MASSVLTVTAEVRGDAKSIIAAFKSAGVVVKDFGSESDKATQSASKGTSLWSRTVGGASKAVIGALALAGGAALTTATAFTFKAAQAGIARLTAIQDATSATGVIMGSAAKAGELMANVLNVVKGTPFNFDQFATAAKNLAAFGVDAAKIPGILTAVGNAAAASGRGAESVDQITTALGQAATAGKITGDTINTLSQAGVPALQILANAHGVTTAKMQEMVSAGAVPALQAIDDLTNGIMNGTNGAAGATVSLGGAMEALRQTFSGAVGGMQAAIARLGAAAIKPFLGDLTTLATTAGKFFDALAIPVGRLAEAAHKAGVIQKLTDWLLKLTDAVTKIGSAKDMGTAFGDMIDSIGKKVPALGLLFDIFDQLKPLLPAVGDLLKNIGKELLPLAPAFGEIVKSVIPLLPHLGDLILKLLPLIIKLLPPVVDLLSSVADALIKVIPAITPLIDWLSDLIGWLGTPTTKALGDFADFLDGLGPVGQMFGDMVRGISDAMGGDGLQGALNTVNGALGDFGKSVGDVFNTVVSSVGDFFAGLPDMISGAIGAVGTAISDGWTGIVSFVTDTLNNLGSFIATVWDGIGKTIGNFMKLILGFFTGDFGSIPGIVQGILASIGQFFADAWNGLIASVTGFFAWLGATWTGFWNSLPGILAAAWNGVVSFISGAVAGFIGFFSALPGNIAAIWGNVVNAVSTGITNVVEWVKGLPGRVGAAVAGAASWLVNTGRDMMAGLISGIVSTAKKIADTVVNTVKDAIGAAGKWLGINSPSRRVRDELGKPMGEGLGAGLDAMKPVVQAKFQALVTMNGVKTDTSAKQAVSSIGNAVSNLTGASNVIPFPQQPDPNSASQNPTPGKVININIVIEKGTVADGDVDELVDKIVEKVRFVVGGNE